MAISKAEGIAYAAGAFSIIGALLARKRVDRQTFANAVLFGGGALLTGGAMSAYRVHDSHRMIEGLSGSRPLGLAHTETHHRAGKTLKVWNDRTMGIRDRVFLLQGLVAKSVKNPEVRKLALGVTGHGKQRVNVSGDTFEVHGAGCTARDDACEAKAIFDWVANPKNVRYTGDVGPHALSPGGLVEAVDEFQSAIRTVEFRGGDCDDHAVLNASLALQNGFPAKFRITSNTGESWDHIYTMVGIPKLNPTRWVALDTTLGPGKFDKQPRRKKEIDFAA